MEREVVMGWYLRPAYSVYGQLHTMVSDASGVDTMKAVLVFAIGLAVGWLLTPRVYSLEPNEQAVLWLMFGDGTDRAPTWSAN